MLGLSRGSPGQKSFWMGGEETQTLSAEQMKPWLAGFVWFPTKQKKGSRRWKGNRCSDGFVDGRLEKLKIRWRGQGKEIASFPSAHSPEGGSQTDPANQRNSTMISKLLIGLSWSHCQEICYLALDIEFDSISKYGNVVHDGWPAAIQALVNYLNSSLILTAWWQFDDSLCCTLCRNYVL